MAPTTEAIRDVQTSPRRVAVLSSRLQARLPGRLVVQVVVPMAHTGWTW